MAAPTYREIDDQPILWTDPQGVTHLCEAADAVPGGARLVWTLCDRGGVPGGRDVPPNEATTEPRMPICPDCLAAGRQRMVGPVIPLKPPARD